MRQGRMNSKQYQWEHLLYISYNCCICKPLSGLSPLPAFMPSLLPEPFLASLLPLELALLPELAIFFKDTRHRGSIHWLKHNCRFDELSILRHPDDGSRHRQFRSINACAPVLDQHAIHLRTSETEEIPNVQTVRYVCTRHHTSVRREHPARPKKTTT